ncbi:glycosyltransferase [bacterium]|nr:glycosyltransferase [bacterium]
MLLSIVINTYERPDRLGLCLEAIHRQKDAEPLELIIVDDGGRMELAPLKRIWSERLPIKWVRIEHGGRSAARNRGVAEAKGERILFLGDDVFVRGGCIARHRIDDPLIAVVGRYPWEKLQGSPPFRHWAEPNPQNDINNPANAGWIHFATGNLSMGRDVFNELGGFDARYTCYGWEDLDLGLRFERAGGRIVFDPDALATHEHPQMSRADLWRREREMGRTALVFAEKWYFDAPGAVAAMKFWSDPSRLRPAPAWRTAIGDRLVAMFDKIAPGSIVTRWLYERMVWSQRLAGVAEAWRDLHAGDRP